VSGSAAELERIEYDEAPVRLFHFRVAIGASGGEFSDGFGLGIIGIALSLATPALHLTALWTGLIAGASLVGIFVGALFAGPAADRLGRRPVFACNMAVLGALSLLQVLARSSGDSLSGSSSEPTTQ
jgi:MFS transporter, putative metabolite transport protein